MALKNTNITGWIRNGISEVSDRLTGNSFKKLRLSSKFQVQKIDVKNNSRWYISTMAGMKDVARGFYRKAVSSALTGNIIKHWKITTRFIGIYIRALQNKETEETGYGRCYQSDTDVELGTGGTGAYLDTTAEIVVYKIKAIMSTTSLLWEEIPGTLEVYTKG